MIGILLIWPLRLVGIWLLVAGLARIVEWLESPGIWEVLLFGIGYLLLKLKVNITTGDRTEDWEFAIGDNE